MNEECRMRNEVAVAEKEIKSHPKTENRVRRTS